MYTKKYSTYIRTCLLMGLLRNLSAFECNTFLVILFKCTCQAFGHIQCQLIDRYNGQKINVVYECPHIYGNALDPPLFPWKFLSAYYTCELGWHMWKSGREGQLYQKNHVLVPNNYAYSSLPPFEWNVDEQSKTSRHLFYNWSTLNTVWQNLNLTKKIV